MTNGRNAIKLAIHCPQTYVIIRIEEIARVYKPDVLTQQIAVHALEARSSRAMSPSQKHYTISKSAPCATDSFLYPLLVRHRPVNSGFRAAAEPAIIPHPNSTIWHVASAARPVNPSSFLYVIVKANAIVVAIHPTPPNDKSAATDSFVLLFRVVLHRIL